MRAFIVPLDRLATLAHGLRVCIEALLYSVEQIFVLPPWAVPALTPGPRPRP